MELGKIRFVICVLKEASSDRIKNVKKKKGKQRKLSIVGIEVTQSQDEESLLGIKMARPLQHSLA